MTVSRIWIAIAAILILLLIGAYEKAHAATWLDEAWSDETVAQTGGPAVTLNQDGVILVLPVATLKAAIASGLSVKDAVRVFLERYAQPCSDVLNMNEPHKGLSVALSLARPANVDGIEIGGIQIPGTLFVTDDEEEHFVIDYAPEKKVHCVVPDEGPVS